MPNASPANPAHPESAADTSLPPSPRQNLILAALPEPEYARLLPDLELVHLPLGAVLYEPGLQMEHVHFPVKGIISLLYVMQSGESAEIALTGNEGLVGVSLFMGGESTTSRAVVQNACDSYRLRAEVVRKEFARGGSLQYLVLLYTQGLMTQMTQTAACNRHHSLDKQLCRWLLLSLDRLTGDALTMTQQLIANMLGVNLAGVGEALDKLQADGLLRYSEGLITVLNRPLLEKRVCECYAVVRKEINRLLPYKLAA